MTSRKSHPWRDLATAFGPDVRRHRRLVGLSYLCRALAVAAAVTAPWAVKLLIDRAVANDWSLTVSGRVLAATPLWTIVALTAGFLLLSLTSALAGAGEKNLSARVRERLTLELRDRLLGHVLTLSPTIRARHRSGELVLRIVDDTDLFVRVLTKTVPQVFQQAVTLVATLGMMAVVDLRVAFAGCVWLPAAALVLRRDAQRLWRASREKRAREGEVCGLAQEIVRGLAVIQASGHARPTLDAFRRLNARRVGAGRHETAVAVSMERSLQIVQAVAMTVVTAGGAYLVLRGRITVGDLSVLIVYMGQLVKPLEKLNDLAETTGRGVAGGERLLRMLSERPAVEESAGAAVLGRSRGVLELRDVWFRYPDRERAVLSGVSLRLQPGELTVLIGASGAGKSTLFSLLVRLFDPDRGRITIDGRAVRELQLQSLRDQFAVLSQDTHLFAGSIREALAPPGVPVDDTGLWRALALVSLDGFVRHLPHRLETPLGEDGVNLSGGQRRRIALARAFLLNRPILLLDEPLANIDAESATVILDALERIRITCTCFAVTHDTALVERADRVCRLDNGQITETLFRALPAQREVG